MNSATTKTTLVLGATGATGRLVVQQLLDQNLPVRVIVRSKNRFYSMIDDDNSSKHKLLLTVTEASITKMTDIQLQNSLDEVDYIVCCLGHNLTFSGIFGHPRRLVSNTVQRVVKLLSIKQNSSSSCPRFILMGSDGVACPGDMERSRTERLILFLLRHLVPPHADNEAAMATLLQAKQNNNNNNSNNDDDNNNDGINMEWTVIRPTDLIDGDTSEYVLYGKPTGSLFGSGTATRANVAKCMVDMITDDDLFNAYKFRAPVLHNKTTTTTTTKKEQKEQKHKKQN